MRTFFKFAVVLVGLGILYQFQQELVLRIANVFLMLLLKDLEIGIEASLSFARFTYLAFLLLIQVVILWGVYRLYRRAWPASDPDYIEPIDVTSRRHGLGSYDDVSQAPYLRPKNGDSFAKMDMRTRSVPDRL